MVGLGALLLLTASMAAPLHADSPGSAYPWLTLVGQPRMDYTGPTPALTVTFTNQSPVQANGTAYVTLHDVLGQTVGIATADIGVMNPGQNATLTFYLAVPFDSYTVDIFVLDGAGTVISATTNSTVIA